MARRMGEAPLPPPARTHVRRLTGTLGVDLRGGREGYLENARNIDPRAFPTITSLGYPSYIRQGLPGTPRSLYAIGQSIFVIFETGGMLSLLRRRADGRETIATLTSKNLNVPRTILPFNRYSDPEDPLGGSWRHMAVIYPDGLWFEPEAETITFEKLEGAGGAPEIEHACVHLSRVFGAKGDRIYACAFNDPSDWNLDTASDTGAANAWASTVQSNTKGSGDFTALCVYDGHVLAFKRRFCHILNNNKNPFRVADLLNVGTVDARTVAEVDGKLFFLGEDGVYRYNGDTATRISEPLGELDFTGAIATAADGMYYLYLPEKRLIYLYAERTGAWSTMNPAISRELVGLASDGQRCWMLSADGTLLATGGGEAGEFLFVTAPVIEDALGRTCRFSMALTTDHLSYLEVSYTDTSGRSTLLLLLTSVRGSRRLVSRAFTPADYGGKITVIGAGMATVHEMSLTVAE